jgi:hypothetical protein
MKFHSGVLKVTQAGGFFLMKTKLDESFEGNRLLLYK